MPPDVARDWDARVEAAVRLGVRFLIRVNRMDALYAAEVARTNRIGIGPTGLRALQPLLPLSPKDLRQIHLLDAR